MTCRTTTTQPKRYLIGNTITVTVVLTDTEGAVVDPANLRMLVVGPSDTTPTAVALTVDGDKAIGSFTPDEAGLWEYRVETFTGPVNAAVERSLVVTGRTVPAPV
jgi:hypothetical protein